MKKLTTKGFAHVAVLLIALAVVVIAGVGYFVYHSAHSKPTATKQTSTSQKAATDSQSTSAKTPPEPPSPTVTSPVVGYLTITEFGIKVPLTEVTKTATYRLGNFGAYFDVQIAGDTNNECAGQAAITKVTNPDENSDDWRNRPSELDKIGSKVNGVYYFIEGSQSTCSTDQKVQDIASQIRSDFLAQGKLIIAD